MTDHGGNAMNVMPAIGKDAAALTQPRARVGLIIPSVNTYSEPQFNHFAPDGLGIHVARARVAGPWKRPLPEMKDEIATRGQASVGLPSRRHRVPLHRHLDDAGAAGRRQNPRHRADATGIDAMATSRLVLEALQTLGMKKVVLLTPYKSNKAVIDYLTAAGVDGGAGRGARSSKPRTSAASRRSNGRSSPRRTTGRTPTASSCPAPTPRQIEAIADIERMLGKPVVNSNQAVLWGCMRRLRGTLAPLKPMPQLGRLMQSLNA